MGTKLLEATGSASNLPRYRLAPARPSFIGVGTQKSGTTWWYKLVSQHPDFVEPVNGRKELHFFDRSIFTSELTTLRSDYERQFRRRDGEFSGEWTPRYIIDLATIHAIGRIYPSMPLLVLLRDPWKRLLSGFRHDIAVGVPPHKALLVATKRSMYDEQLAALEQLCPENPVLVLQYEQCLEAPQQWLEHTLDFLGMPRFVATDGVGRVPSAAGPRPEASLPADLHGLLKDRTRAAAEALIGNTLCGHFNFDLWSE